MVPLALLESLGHACYFAWRALAAAILAFGRPRQVLFQLYHVLLGTLPLAVVAGSALGMVIWLHLHRVLARFDADQFLPQALALAVVLEFAPTGAGLIVSGRSGASLAAELSSMRLTEQLEALELLGQSPLRLLVGPRVLACMLALPLLTVFMAWCALGGGFLAEYLGGGMSWVQYRSECLRGLRLADVLPAILKTVVFGYLIGVTACCAGLRTGGGTDEVGRAATRGVVGSTLLVLASNVLLVRSFQALGMAA